MILARRAILATALAAHGVRAEVWPARPIRLIVPYPPGGPTDVLARLAAQVLGARLPQPVVVENRAGGTGTAGTDAVARAAPDGSTFVVNPSAHVIQPHLVKQPFDALADFAPVTCIATVPLILLVTPGLPVRSVIELIALAKAEPGRLSYASSSNGGAPHLAGELFKQMAGVDLQHVPYRGSGQAVPDLIAGNVQLMFESLASSADLVRQGRLRALAVTTAERLAVFPDLPTISEAGVPGYIFSTWYGLWAPGRTPPAILDGMQQALAAGLAGPEASARLASLGALQATMSPADFAQFVAAESARYAKLIRAAGIAAD